VSGNSFWYDLIHPQTADLGRPQTWRDWATKTYYPTMKDVGSAALDDVSFGTADLGQAAAIGESVDAIRKRTAASQAALGPMGPVINALTYAVPGLGEAKAVAVPGRAISALAKATRPALGRYGAAAAEGGAANAASSIGHQVGGENGIDWSKVGIDTATGAAVGPVAQTVGDVTAPTVRRVADYVSGKPGRAAGAPWWEDLRHRSLAGENITPDLSRVQQTLRPGSAGDRAIQDVSDAAAASIEPGWMSKGARAATTLGAGGYGLLKSGGWGGLAGMAGADRFNAALTDPIARFVNRADRKINVNQAFDQFYPAMRDSPVTTNVEPWADALRQLSIGGVR
jgi:hypothetical protein